MTQQEKDKLRDEIIELKKLVKEKMDQWNKTIISQWEK